jgi:hypothetical protein
VINLVKAFVAITASNKPDSLSSSSATISIFFPSIPPSAFICSTAKIAPFKIELPTTLSISAQTPILIVSDSVLLSPRKK